VNARFNYKGQKNRPNLTIWTVYQLNLTIKLNL